ncbi:putative trans-sialidase [Trypanosoma cruzi]|nr:putative trans-sialidase [Trypanosoma cruzi]
MSLAGQLTSFRRTHAQPINEKSCPVILMAIGDVAPSIRPQHARMLRSMSQMYRTPPDMVILGLPKIAARSETKQARPLTTEKMNQFVRSRTDWKQCVVLRPAWMTASFWSDIAVLTPKTFYTGVGRDHNSGLARGSKDGEGGSPPRPAVRPDARAGCVQHYKVMRNTSRKRRAHESYDCPSETSSGFLECHGVFHKTGCAAEIVESHNLDPHVISRLAGHVDPFDLPQGTVRYLGNCNTVLTQVSSLVALV